MTKLNQASMTFSNTIILIGGVVAAVVAVTDVGRPYGQPATQASPGAARASPPFGEYQAQGRGR